MAQERANYPSDFREVERWVSEALYRSISRAMGTCVSFTPKTLLEYINKENVIPVVLTLIKHILEELYRHGLLEKDQSRSIVRYRVCRNSPLWNLAKDSQDPSKILTLLMTIVE
ncbi:hypothetical protein [Caldivirga sp.]|jgi:hypothetical protein|uniref:hypothetical protein n=1 Tax=Caldivirga sp. TaxID=2080243 RepID=UPI0025C1A099|nr:hypothetical protein [Caldivirga sp.]